MDNDRVCFWGSNNLAYGINLNKIETMEIPEYNSIDINDAIEFYEIRKYFDDGAYSKSWADEQRENYNKKSKKLFGLTMRFINALADSTIVQEYEKIEDYQYRTAFWQLFDKCKLYNKISEAAFILILQLKHSSLRGILLHKSIVMKYGEAISKHLLGSFENMRYIIHVYDQYYTESEKLYLPIELTPEKIFYFMDSYIDSDNPNIHYLDDISLMQSNNVFSVTDRLRLKAKRKSKEIGKTLFKNSVPISFETKLSFSSNQNEDVVIKDYKQRNEFIYNENWLLKTLDYPSILNNFHFLFDFADYPQIRCMHVAKESESGILERTMQSKSTRRYPVNHAFRFIDGLAQMQMHAYYVFLSQNNIRYEDVLGWFFTKYLQEEFKCPEMRISLPSKETTYLEKCIIICSQLESVLRQFTLYVEDDEIDFELLEFMQDSKKFKDIPSLVENKYLYGKGKDLEDFKFALFSDQCMLSFVKRIYEKGKSYKNLFDLLFHEDVYISDYREQDASSLKWLEENGLIATDESGLIKLGNIYKVAIIKQLFENGVISEWHFEPKANLAIEEWLQKGYLIEKSSLLTEQEADYFNYILNNAEFVNGLRLRNKYSHGNEQAITDEDKHKNNYYYFLRILTILAIKINDDFILKELHDKAKTQE